MKKFYSAIQKLSKKEDKKIVFGSKISKAAAITAGLGGRKREYGGYKGMAA